MQGIINSSSVSHHNRAEMDCTKGVIVAHPGTQHSYQTAIALQQSGFLMEYHTSFYYKENSIFSVLSKWPIFSQFERALLKRKIEGFCQDDIYTHPFWEMMYVFFARKKIPFGDSEKLMRYRNEVFDRALAQRVIKKHPSILIAYDTCALKMFHGCRKAGTIAVLDQTIGHLNNWMQIAEEEALLQPDFADSLKSEIPEHLVERCAQEALEADHIFAASSYVANTLVENGVSKDKIIYLPYGVNVDAFFPDPSKKDNDKFTILFAGGIGQRKGIAYLLEAVKRLKIPNLELILVGAIVGSGKGLDPYRDFFTHVHHVPKYEVAAWFQRADIFVFPSLHEGSSLVIYEALASGLPVVTTENAGSVVRDGVDGYIVPIRDVEALMEKILLLYQDCDLRESMSKSARERAENFTWAHYRLRLVDTVRSLISGEVNN